MAEFWESAFADKQLMWGAEPTRSARLASEHFARTGARDVLIPGLGYGRNAKPFLERGMAVTGIEISETAIGLARSTLGLDIPIHHGSVTDMPFDDRVYDGIFCHGLLYLLDAPARAKVIADCRRQLAPGGAMIFTLIAKTAPMYGRGTCIGDDWYQMSYGVALYFYDEASVQRDFGPNGTLELSTVDEPSLGVVHPFIFVVCTTPA
jgi:SAM-dependent methyltransferase